MTEHNRPKGPLLLPTTDVALSPLPSIPVTSSLASSTPYASASATATAGAVTKEPSTSAYFNDMLAVSEADTDLPPPTTASTTELGYLNEVTELVIKQGVSLSNLGPADKEPSLYLIEEKGTGEKLYRVYDDSVSLHQRLCGPNRPFRLRLMDTQDRELIQVEKPYVTCDACLGLTSFFDLVNVWVRNYKSKQFEWRRFGQIRQLWCPLKPYFSVKNAIGETELSIRGPFCTSLPCLGPVVFSIMRAGQAVGSITREPGVPCKEYPTGTPIFSLKFPPGIDEKLKVTLIGALLLIHFKFFEPLCKCCKG